MYFVYLLRQQDGIVVEEVKLLFILQCVEV